MEIQKVYVKKRLEFGKQCVWTEVVPMLDVDIPPNPSEMRQYIMRTECHVGPQKSTQLAAHEAQTIARTTKNYGMYHFEGGWPKEVNPRDEETTTRFRRRVEKDDHWAPKLLNLFGVMEEGILQNGAVNLYQHYFDDMVPTELMQPISLRAVKVYTDPQMPRRPVTDISVSSDDGRRIVVSYCFLEFGRRADYSNTVYVWQVDNPNEPYMAMQPFCPCVTCEFNPRDPSILASGLMTGQVCNWDLRISEKPVQHSDLQYSHRAYANAVKWIPTKTNTEFFSTSMDGCALWWDTRWLRQPVEKLIMDLDKPNEPSMERSVGVSSTNFGPMVGTKFMCGLDNGVIVTGSRKAKTNAEKMAAKFTAHFGPVYAVDRNVLNPSIFMSVGDWRVKIWAEDTREGNLISTLYSQAIPTTGCWDKIRNSVFYVATDAGTLVAWDILQNLRKPIFKLQLCNAKITVLAPYEQGTFMAVGNYNGTSYLVESTDFLQHFDRKDRAVLSEYFERCSKLTKAVDARLREIKLMQKLTSDWGEPAPKVKETRRSRKKEKVTNNDNNNSAKKQSRDSRKKFKNDTITIQMSEAENKYYEIVGQELLKYESTSEPELCPIGPIIVGGKKQDRKGKKNDEKDRMSVKDPKMKMKTGRRLTGPSLLRMKTLSRRIKAAKKSSVTRIELPADLALATEPLASTETKLSKKEKKKKQMIKFRLPVPCKKEICKPKVCCFRRKRGSSGKKTREEPKTRISSWTSSMLTDGTMVTASTKQPSGKEDRSQQEPSRWKMLNLPVELMQEVQRAKRDVREFALSGTVRKRRKRYTKTVPEEKRKPNESERSRKTAGNAKVGEGEVEGKDSSVSKEDSSEAKLSVKGRRKVTIGPDPCSPQRKRSITTDFSEVISVPLSKSTEEEREEGAEEGKAYIKEILAMQDRVYPRISEFHTIE